MKAMTAADAVAIGLLDEVLPSRLSQQPMTQAPHYSLGSATRRRRATPIPFLAQSSKVFRVPASPMAYQRGPTFDRGTWSSLRSLPARRSIDF